MSYEVPEDDAVLLRQIIGIKADDPLPQKMVSAYKQLVTCLYRIDARTTPNDLAMICCIAGYGKESTEAERRPPTIVEQFAQGIAKIDSPVIVHWRGEDVKGVLKAVNAAGQPVVQLDGFPDERIVDVATVKLLA